MQLFWGQKIIYKKLLERVQDIKFSLENFLCKKELPCLNSPLPGYICVGIQLLFDLDLDILLSK